MKLNPISLSFSLSLCLILFLFCPIFRGFIRSSLSILYFFNIVIFH